MITRHALDVQTQACTPSNATLVDRVLIHMWEATQLTVTTTGFVLCVP